MAQNPIWSKHFIVAQSMASTINSVAMSLEFQDNAYFNLIWSGSPVGIFNVQTSNDHQQDGNGNVQVAGTWETITLSNPITAAGSADSAGIVVAGIAAPWIRIQYVASSGSGTLDAYFSAKGI
jgi:hypothetical protein